jgi:L-malate glycosyltransferase
LINKPQKRGAETFTCQLSNHLQDLGHTVKIVSVFKGEAIMPFQGQIISLNASSKRRFFDYLAWKRLAEIINEFKPDLVQVNAGDTLKYTVFSKLFFAWKAPIIARNASEIGKYIKSVPQKFFNSFLYRNVDYAISVSRASEKDLLTQFPFLHGKTEVVPVGLEISENIHPIAWKQPEIHNIVHVGGFTFEKNHKGLINIFINVLELNRDVRLHMVGDGPLRSEVEDMVTRLNLWKNVCFHGFVDNPLSFIKNSDLLVLPSIIEGLPGVILEAMYVKTPVIAYDVGGISEILKPNTGVVIQKNDEIEFANAILENLIHTDADKVNTAYNLVTTEFMNSQLAVKFVKAYHKILKNRS